VPPQDLGSSPEQPGISRLEALASPLGRMVADQGLEP